MKGGIDREVLQIEGVDNLAGLMDTHSACGSDLAVDLLEQSIHCRVEVDKQIEVRFHLHSVAHLIMTLGLRSQHLLLLSLLDCCH